MATDSVTDSATASVVASAIAAAGAATGVAVGSQKPTYSRKSHCANDRHLRQRRHGDYHARYFGLAGYDHYASGLADSAAYPTPAGCHLSPGNHAADL